MKKILCICNKDTGKYLATDLFEEGIEKGTAELYFTWNFEQARAIIKEENIDRIIFIYSAINCEESHHEKGFVMADEVIDIFNKITTIPTYIISSFETKQIPANHVKFFYPFWDSKTAYQEIVQV